MRIGETTLQNEFTSKYNTRFERDVMIWLCNMSCYVSMDCVPSSIVMSLKKRLSLIISNFVLYPSYVHFSSYEGCFVSASMHYINQFLYRINTWGVSENVRQINIPFVIKTTGFIVLLLNSLSIWFVTSVDRNYAGCFLANCSSIKVPHYWQT
jgi:hypothetical protein